MACCGGSGHEDSNVADSGQMILKDSVTKADHLASEMALQVESGIVLEQVRNIYDIVKHESQDLGGNVESDLLDKAPWYAGAAIAALVIALLLLTWLIIKIRRLFKKNKK